MDDTPEKGPIGCAEVHGFVDTCREAGVPVTGLISIGKYHLSRHPTFVILEAQCPR